LFTNREGVLSSNRNDHDEPQIRVTDRRRIYLDDDSKPSGDGTTDEPNLKPSYVEELEARTRAAENLAKEVQTRFDQVRAQLQREMDETRQRLNRAADERAQRESANFVASLLPVLDNLQRAREAAETDSAGDLVSEGVRRTAESFEKALRDAGVEPVESVGQPFDPELHEAVETTDAGPEMEEKVVAEYTRGYRMGDRLLRPSRVKVGRAAAKSEFAS
jgi:molecular chaperone GrpE